MFLVTDAPDVFEIHAEIDVFDRESRACRVQFPVNCGPKLVTDPLPVVGRFALEGLRLDYVGYEGRSYAPTAFLLPGGNLAEIYDDRLPSHPIGMDYVTTTRFRHASGRRLTSGDYRTVGRGDAGLAERYGTDAPARMDRAAEELKAAVGRRFIVADGRPYVQTSFPTWMADPALGVVRLEVPAFACAPDRHLLKFGLTRLEEARAFVSAIGDGRWPEPRVLGVVEELDRDFDDRNDAAQICIAANAYLGEVFGRLVLGMPGHLVRVWRDLREIETIVSVGEGWRASAMLPDVLGLMDHAEAVGCVDPVKAGSGWTHLRTRLVSVEGVMATPSVPLEAPRP